MIKPYYDRHGIAVYQGDNLEVMRGMDEASVHALVTDPPAGIRFMNRAWDSDMGGRHSWVEWLSERMREAFRVLKPGGYGLVWAMPRTSHWTAWALEDAGFEIRDCVVHLFGAGFPKSLDVSKAIDKAAGATREVIGQVACPAGNKPGGSSLNMSVVGMPATAEITAPATDAAREWFGWGTALKPAAEHWWLIRKPMTGTVAVNVQEHSTGAINVDACRVGRAPDDTSGWATSGSRFSENDSMSGPNYDRAPKPDNDVGRWPTNAVLDEHAAAELDAQSGTLKSGLFKPEHADNGKTAGTLGAMSGRAREAATYGDMGGASRFFPVFRYEAKAPTVERPKVDGKAHPTVKPLDLMRWMVRLVCVPGGTVLDPFAGTGTTGHAARAEGMRAVLIEQDAGHLPLIVSRLDGYRVPAQRDATTGASEPVDLLDLLDDQEAAS